MNHENAVRPCAEADVLKLVHSLRALDAKQLLQAAIERGLTFGDCINAFGVTPEENAFVSAAQAMPDDDIEFDDRTVVSRSERGAFVHCWHFVPNEAAGIPEPSVMLEALQYFAATHQGGGDPQLKAKYLALAQLMDVLGAEFDELEGTPREVVPSCFDLGDASIEMLPSRLVAELAATALDQGFSPVLAEALLNWIEHQGNLLDQLRLRCLWQPPEARPRCKNLSLDHALDEDGVVDTCTCTGCRGLHRVCGACACITYYFQQCPTAVCRGARDGPDRLAPANDR